MAWNRKAQRTRAIIKVHDFLEGEVVRVERVVEEAEGHHSFGRFSYRGESVRLHMGLVNPRSVSACSDWWDDPWHYEAEYPPARRRCRTPRAIAWWDRQAAAPPGP